MKATLVKVDFIKGSKPRFMSSDYSRPANTVTTGSGYHVIIDIPSEIRVIVEAENGLRYKSEDIISEVRCQCGWQKITDNRIKLLTKFLDGATFNVDTNGRITNLGLLVEKFAAMM